MSQAKGQLGSVQTLRVTLRVPLLPLNTGKRPMLSGFTQLEESLLLLTGVENQLVSALKSLASKERAEDDDLKWTVSNHIQILVCSFLEEWKIFESLGSNATIRDTLKMISPAITRIKEWTGLTRIRSTMLAHPQRDKGGNPVWPWDVFNSYKSPTAYAETILLGNLAVIAVKAVRSRHHAEYHLAAQRLSQRFTPIREQGIRTAGEIERVLQKVRSEMSEIAKKNLAMKRVSSRRLEMGQY